MITAPVNKIIPFSSVDGPGNRTAVFFQGCNWDCCYCHNPEIASAFITDALELIPPYSKKGVLKKDAIMAHAKDLVEKFDIRPAGSESRPAGTLSGGNQQKVIIAREITNDKDLLIAVNPTRGLDVGAIEFVHRYLVEQRNKNKAVLLVSFELDEIMSVSDRIEVIFDGQITGSMPAAGADEKTLGIMMAGGKQHEA